MSELIMVSPLLDGYTVEKTVMTQRDRTWYSVRHTASGETFVLKHLSVPASDAQVRALILSGIYRTEEEVKAYYTELVADIKRELDLGKNLSETGCFAGAADYQIVEKSDVIGYDIYILQSLQFPLSNLIREKGITHLRAINMAIDLCDAIIACREAGYIFANLKPDNIFYVPSGKFLLGDLGLVSTKYLEYAGISEDYIGPFSPPELFSISGIPNVTLDLYSLGMVLYWIYNGNHGPFQDENTDEAMANKLRLSGKPLPTPIYADYELAGIITKACSYRIENRYTSPEQLKEALLLYLQRNQIPNTLVVPPLVVDPEPVKPEESEETANDEPLRMVDVKELDAAFKANFAPNTENVGDEVPEQPAPTVAPEVQPEPAAEATPEVQSEPADEATPEVQPEPADEATPEVQPEPTVEVAPEKPAEDKDALLSANAVSGPKMPTGNLKMSKKGKRSRRRENLVLEIPRDPEESAIPVREDTTPVTVRVDDATEPSKKNNSTTLSFSPESAPVATEEVDIDQLIASVNEVVGADELTAPKSGDDHPLTMHVAPVDTGYHDPYHQDSHVDPSEETERKPKSKWFPIAIITLLSIAIIGVIAFLMSNYYVNITELKLLDHSTESLTVELITSDEQECFIVTCTDNYGNSYPRTIDENSYTFSGLRENTAYTVTVIASEYHRLRSGKSHTITVKTPGSTKISDFTARRGTQPGDIVLNFNSEGPSPEDWQYTYTDDKGVLSGPFNFTDHTALVTGLTEGVTYTFAIEAPRDLYLSGETSVEYTLLPIVTVTALHIEDVHDTTVSLAWSCEENFPAEWTVTCESGEYSKALTTSDLKITFNDLPDLQRDYTFSVIALGMDEPAILELPANPVILEDLKAENQEDGTVKVSWNTPAGVPAGGWHLTYNTVGSLHVSYVVRDITDNSVTLTGLIPNAEYAINLYLTAEDASVTMFGQTSTTVVTPEAKAFDGYSMDPTPVFTRESGNLSLWLCPEEEDWTYRDLKKTRNEFTKDERIAVCLQVQSVAASDDTVSLMYVLRNEEGQVVTDETKEFTWDSLWFDRRHANEVPLPKAVGESTSIPGKYTLEIYINGMLLLRRDFTIV